jgi:hypothetical protein
MVNNLPNFHIDFIVNVSFEFHALVPLNCPLKVIVNGFEVHKLLQMIAFEHLRRTDNIRKIGALQLR